MTGRVILTDELVRRALASIDTPIAPAGLLDTIMADVHATPRKPRLLERWHRDGSGFAPAPRGTLRWLVLAAVAILAIVAGLIVAGGSPERPVVVAEESFGSALSLRSLGVGPEDAWVTDGELWHRTANGWFEFARYPLAFVRDIAQLPDGRVALAGDGGSGVLDGSGRWTALSDSDAMAIVADAAGTLWVAESVSDAVIDERPGFAAYRPSTSGWDRTWIACPAGGGELAVDTGGRLWTAGIAYTGTAGMGRWDGSRCDEVLPLPDAGRADMMGLAAGPGGVIAIVLSEPPATEGQYAARTMLYDGATWATIRTNSGVLPARLAFGPGGELYAGLGDGIWRYRAGTWVMVVPGAHWYHLSVTPDGTLWYAKSFEDGSTIVGHVRIDDLPAG